MIISNSTPLIYLAKISRLDMLKDVFKQVIIPQSVFSEVVEMGEERNYPDAKIIRKATEEWIKVKELSKKEIEDFEEIIKIAPLGRGEAEAISLAKNMKLPVIVDDSIAHKIARLYKIDSYWTTSVIFKAVKMEIIEREEAKVIVEDLINAGLRIKPEVLIEIMKRL